MINFSKNKKLNGVLNEIYTDLIDDLGMDEILRYYNEFRGYSDYNIVEYGNMCIYYVDIYDLYERHGYKSTSKYSETKIWTTYKRQVGYIVRYIVRKERLNGKNN